MSLDAEKLFFEAVQQLEAGQVGEATERLLQLADRFPGYGPGPAMLGDIFSNRFRDFAKAEGYFKQAMEAGDTARAYTGYALLLILTERFAEANACLNKAANLPDGEKDEVHRLFGMLHEAQVQLDEAVASYKKAILATFSDSLLDACEKAIARCEAKKKYL
jgi:tetratricopeptide (TPR) repeat protein